MGSSALSWFVVVGEAVSEALALQKVGCRIAEVPVLITEAVKAQVAVCCLFWITAADVPLLWGLSSMGTAGTDEHGPGCF